MTKIIASDDMRRIVNDLIASGRITRTLAEYAYAQGFTDQDIIAAREKTRLSSASLEIQSRPLAYKRQAPQSNPGEPTSERMRHAKGYMGRGGDDANEARSRGAIKRYQLRSVMDIHGDKFETEHRTVFSAFVGDAEIHRRIRVANLDATGGGGQGRLGGLGNVPDHIRDRHNRYDWASRRLTRLEREVCDILVTHCIAKRDGTPFTPVEYGRMSFTSVSEKDLRFHLGAAVNGFRHLCDHLVELYHDPLCPRPKAAREYLSVVEGEQS